MQTQKPYLRLSAVIILLPMVALLIAQETQTVPDQGAMEDHYQRLAAPRAEHQKLAMLEGNWGQEVRLWPAPGAEPLIARGTSRNTMILGGRFLKSESISGEGEMYTESLTIYGFDNRHGVYTLVGYDTWGTYYVTASGPVSADSNVIIMTGSEADPIMGFDQEYKMVMRFEGQDRYITQLIFTNPEMTGGAAEFKMVEIINVRQK